MGLLMSLLFTSFASRDERKFYGGSFAIHSACSVIFSRDFVQCVARLAKCQRFP